MRDKPLVLLIDDEQSLIETLTVLLRGEGYDVIFELTGAGGLKAFKDQSPDLVLSDVRMPKMSGIEVLEEIRRTSPNTPVVLMTAQASLQSAIQAVNLGATHYVQKPFENDELLAVLGRSLDWGRLKQENAGLKRELKKVQTLKTGKPIGVSPTFEAAAGVDRICTRIEPCPFHAVSADEVIGSGRPVAVLVATPALPCPRTGNRSR